MKVLSMEELTKTVGDKTLFQSISFSIAESEKIGILGINGTGKTTLLNIIAGIDDFDSGKKDQPNDYAIAYLPQHQEINENLTILDFLYESRTPVFSAIKAYERALQQLQQKADQSSVQEELIRAQQRMDELSAWETSAEAKSILTKLGLPDASRPLSELSGGQKKRALLAKTLLAPADLLILDEPTNHLDYNSIKWLQEYLKRAKCAVLFVTHDRYFLDEVTSKIWELERGRLHEYKGNYGDFLEAKAVREENESLAQSKKESLFKKELAWMRRGAKARTTKQKARIQRFEALDEDVKGKQADSSLEMDLGGARLGKKVLEFKSISKSFSGQTLFHDFSFLLKRGDRIGIVGQNGSGKSTLLNILAGREGLDAGEVDQGQTVKIGYYTQETDDMDDSLRMIEYIRETADAIQLKDGSLVSAAQMLERFLFPMHTHGTLIRKLSGGEKRRLYLLNILMSSPNVLLLDEPTNDLDTQTLTILEDYLETFPGVVLTVSHDRYFLDKTCQQLFVFRGNGVIDHYYGSYSGFLEEKTDEVEPAEEKPKAASSRTERKKKLSYSEKREWETIEEDMEKLEERLAAIATEMAAAGSDFGKLNDLMDEEAKVKSALNQMMERWAYLAEIAES